MDAVQAYSEVADQVDGFEVEILAEMADQFNLVRTGLQTARGDCDLVDAVIDEPDVRRVVDLPSIDQYGEPLGGLHAEEDRVGRHNRDVERELHPDNT